LAKCNAHGACQKQRIHLRLAAQDTRGNRQSQPDNFALDFSEVTLALPGKTVNEVNRPAQPLPFGCHHSPCLRLALCLTTLKTSLRAARFKSAARLLSQPAIELGLASFGSLALGLVLRLIACTALKESC
jgi:hypothetical protein